MSAPELSSRLLAQHRRNRGVDVIATFRHAGVSATLVRDARQMELLEALGHLAADAEKGSVSTVESVVNEAAETALADMLIVMADEPRRSPAVLVAATSFFAALKREPFFADRDGLLVIEPRGASALFLDYHAANPAADAQITRYGAWRRKA